MVATTMVCQDILSLTYDTSTAFWVGIVIVGDATSEANESRERNQMKQRHGAAITAPAVASDTPITTSSQWMTIRCGNVHATVSGTTSTTAVAGATSGDAIAGPSSGGATAVVIATAVMAKLEEPGRLLPARTAGNVRPAHVDDMQATPQPVDDGHLHSRSWDDLPSIRFRQ